MAEEHAAQSTQSEQREVRDAYGASLLFLFVSTLGLIASNAAFDRAIAIAAFGLQFGALLLTLRVSGVGRRWFRLGLGIAGLMVVAILLGTLFWGDAGDVVAHIGWASLTGFTIMAIARRLSTYRRITLQMVLGLLCIYMLAGIFFGLVYGIIGLYAPDAFSQPLGGVSSALYFSFVTMATVGYGDITAVGPIGRAVVIAQSIFGQLYLVSVVSLAVSRLGAARQEPPIIKEHE